MGFVFSVASLSAQYQKATEAQKKEIIDKITQAAGEMNTMQCDFIQVRELTFMDDKTTSEGKMYFKKTNKIRLEYTKPTQYVLSMDGKNLNMTSNGQITTINANQNRLFNELSKVMVGGVSGSGLVDSPDFDTQFFVGSDDYKVILTPQIKAVKDLFSAIQLYVGQRDNRIRSVELLEKSGDKMTITLKNLQINTAINDELFSQ
jgi:outer membrane lipoprotein-sorting protein